MMLMYNFFCRDINAQFAFYESLLGLTEIKEYGNDIYRVLDGKSFQIGFNALKAYDLLDLADRKSGLEESPRAVFGLPTLVLDGPEAVERVAARSSGLGGKVVKTPFVTYYGQYQAIVSDLEDNVLRVSSLSPPK